MQKEKLIPLGKRLLVMRDETNTKTSGGILLPDVAQEAPRRGKVIAVGDSVNVTRLDVGDEVLLPRYGGTDVAIEGQPLLLIEEEDVLGKFHVEQIVVPPPAAPSDDLDEPLGDRQAQACDGEVCESCQ